MRRERLQLQVQAPPPAPARPAPAAPALEPLARRRHSILGIPLTNLHLRRLEELEQLVGRSRYLGWGREGVAGTSTTRSTIEAFFVDLVDSTGSVERFTGDTLHLAIGAALRARRGTS